ncbi:MAG: class I SAM-dependent methyltransferase [Anaerolineae bacterium]|nr:class I SAM-dependent methyltransferase [Anaerolineae bacterium]
MAVLKKAVAPLVVGIAAMAAGILWWRRESERRPLPCPSQFSWLLENPFMDAVAGAEATLDRIGVRAGEQVLDVGSGPGRLAIPAARRVGSGGSVTAVDVQPAMLARLWQRAESAGLTNIETRLMDVGAGEGLEPGCFDRAWLVTVLGEIPDRERGLQAIYGALKPGGTLSITEILPDPHYQRHKTVLELVQSAGFEPTQHWRNLFAYTQNFVKPG